MGRKFQICNGYLLEFEQLARVLNLMAERPTARKIGRAAISEGTGLSERQIESLVSVAAAMGLVRSGVQVLTELGALVARYDVFLETRGSLEWCHYKGAGSYRNLVWYDLFNTILTDETPMTPEDWARRLREKLAGQYTERTIGKHLHEEVRFVADAYINRNFNRLELLYQSSDGLVARRRYLNPDRLVFAAMLYDYVSGQETSLVQIRGLLETAGAPGVLFNLDDSALRPIVEDLHDRGWIRYEGTHNLDQVRLKTGYTSIDFMTAYYEDREPLASEGK